MPLKADQRAMLQLLLERGQSYDDLASVLGVSSDEVRARAREALRELGGADPDAEVGLTDYLLGQADPIGRADAVRHIQSDPETAALAEKIAAQLQLLAPDAELPDLPRAKGAKSAKAPRAERPRKAPAEPRERGESRAAAVGSTARRWWEERRAQSIALLATAGAIIVVAILLLTGVIGGGDDEGSAAEDSPALLGYPLAPLEVDKDGEIKGALPGGSDRPHGAQPIGLRRPGSLLQRRAVAGAHERAPAGPAGDRVPGDLRSSRRPRRCGRGQEGAGGRPRARGLRRVPGPSSSAPRASSRSSTSRSRASSPRPRARPTSSGRFCPRAPSFPPRPRPPHRRAAPSPAREAAVAVVAEAAAVAAPPNPTQR